MTEPFAGGNLGIIIVQQSSRETLLEGSETLTGEPVYTVYFDSPAVGLTILCSRVAVVRHVFRPATRGDTPVAVEALFGIPLQ